jgi:hypothetical protein
MWIMSISLLFLSGPQAFLKSILILCLSKLEYPVLQTGLFGFGNRICPASKPDSRGIPRTCPAPRPDISSLLSHIQPLSQFLEALTGHVWPPDISGLSAFPRANQVYPAPMPDSRGISRTWPATDPDMSGFLAHQQLFWLSRKNRTIRFLKPDYSVFTGLKP